jgi:hypothetical protein
MRADRPDRPLVGPTMQEPSSALAAGDPSALTTRRVCTSMTGALRNVSFVALDVERRGFRNP